MSNSDESLLDNLPIPQNDGACGHLVGESLPRLQLAPTAGDLVDLSKLSGRIVAYCYPMTGNPGAPLPKSLG